MNHYFYKNYAKMLEKFERYIFEMCKIEPQTKIILALSGGVDSCVLLDLCIKMDLEIALAHCNFKLRGTESDENEIFVNKLAQKYKLPFFLKIFDTKELASRTNDSIQMLARKLRYEWFLELLQTNNYDCIATAHHTNDVLETVVLNFTRGTGISGFHGIKPLQNKIIRPLLFASKAQIIDYAKSYNIDYQEDSSNAHTKYHRNLIRQEVIPILKKINPNLENTVTQTIEKINVVEQIYANFIKKFSENNIQNKNGFVEILASSCKKYEAFVLFSIITNYGFNFTQAKQILLCNTIGRVFFAANYQLLVDRKTYIISPKTININQEIIIQSIDYDVKFGTKILKFECIEMQNFIPKRNTNCIYLDSKKIKFPLVLRLWKPGDTMQPFGLNGTKKN